MAGRLLAPLHLLRKSSAPSSPAEGDVYFDTANKRAYVYDGTAWQPCSSGIFREVKEYVVPDTIAVPSGATNYLPAFFLSFKTTQTVKLVGWMAIIQEGTSATFKLQDNGSDITGFTGLEGKTTQQEGEPTAVTMTTKHRIAPVVTAVSGTPKNLSIGIILEHFVL